MKASVRFFGVAFAVIAVLCACSLLSFAQAKHAYVGPGKCKMCHNTEKSGFQYKKWAESKHAEAYKMLASPAAKEAGKKVGVEDPQKSEKCLKCHVSGYAADASLKTEKYNPEDGVTCESCHGAGGDYWKKQVMEDVKNKKVDPATVGLNLAIDEKLCKGCHNPESPSYKEFNFEEMHKNIAHPAPKQ
jgi:formate-dependent nitrite reductase cytochrome c552 subunit